MRPKHLRLTLYKLVRAFENFLEKDNQLLRDIYPEFEIGPETYGWIKVFGWGEGSTLKIGAYTSISKDVTILLGGEHHTDWVTTFPFPSLWESAQRFTGHPKTKGDVLIGNDVWIGYGVTILSGISIGNGAVIGARSVVTRDVEPFSIVAGNPARFIRKRFTDEEISLLQKIAWWKWPKPDIEKALPLLLSRNLDKFFEFANQKKPEILSNASTG
jgi:acetyltransferase-like isoleucine patch superfamily enzyme